MVKMTLRSPPKALHSVNLNKNKAKYATFTIDMTTDTFIALKCIVEITYQDVQRAGKATQDSNKRSCLRGARFATER